MQRIKKGDDVIVNAGKDKGRRGTVLEVKDERVLVEGLNIARKHVRPDPNRGEGGGIQDKEMPLHASNLNLYNPRSGKGERVGYKFLDEGDVKRKVRYFKSDGEVVDV
jgi:large subunit ribosomal protein L24